MIRSRSSRYIAGVAGGIGERFALDPQLVRIGLVGVTLIAPDGLGFLVLAIYFVLWVGLPTVEDRSVVRRFRTGAGMQEFFGAFLLTAAAIVGILNPGFWLVAVLGGISWLLLSDRPEVSPGATASVPSSPPPVAPDPASAPAEPSDEHLVAGLVPDSAGAEVSDDEPGLALPPVDQVDPATRWGRRWKPGLGPRGEAEASKVRAPRRPSLFPLAAIAVFGAAIVLLTLEQLVEPGLDPLVWISVIVTVVGLVTMIGAWRGRISEVVVLLAVPAALVWLPLALINVPRYSGVGVRMVKPEVMPSDGALVYEHGYGQLDIDLSALTVPEGETLMVTTKATAGSTQIVLPPDVTVEVRHRLGFGESMIYVVEPEPYRVPGALPDFVRDPLLGAYPLADGRIYDVRDQRWRRTLFNDQRIETVYPPVPRCTRWRVGEVETSVSESAGMSRPENRDEIVGLVARTEAEASGFVVLENNSDPRYFDWLMDSSGQPCEEAGPMEPAGGEESRGRIIVESEMGVGELTVTQSGEVPWHE